MNTAEYLIAQLLQITLCLLYFVRSTYIIVGIDLRIHICMYSYYRDD